MKLLITGGKGMLGRTLRNVLREHEIVVADLPEADITDAAGFDQFLADSGAETVIHCAAMTAVDKCESETDAAYRLNAFGSGSRPDGAIFRSSRPALRCSRSLQRMSSRILT